MSISSTFDSDRNIIVMRISGNITVPELVEGYDAIFSHPEFHPDMDAIWDLSGLDLKKIPISQIRLLPSKLRKYTQRRGTYKAALVTSRLADFYLLRVYVGILKLIGGNIHLRLFRSIDGAYEWIAGETGHEGVSKAANN